MTALGAYSDKGRVKQVDQDACCFLEAETLAGRVVMAVVCDGVGGLSKGELASSTVVRRFVDWFQLQLPRFIEYNAADEAIMDSLRNVWDTLLQMSSEDIFKYSGLNDVMLGTTFTGMIVVGDRYLIAHVGDCRAYEVSGSEARQLTHDQTLVAQQLAAGLLTPKEAANHPKRNVIMQSVGTSASVEPEFVIGSYDGEATYVFCCDGLYNRLQPDELFNRLSPSSLASEAILQETCERLVSDIMSRGEKDNITILAFSDAVCDERTAEPPVTEEPPMMAADDDESPTIVVDEDESPTIVVKGGGR